MFNEVLVGVDGEQGGRDAVALATRLTAPTRKLTLAHVYPYHGDPSVRGYDEHEAVQITRARRTLQAATEWTRRDTELRWIGAASPGRGLHRLAETMNADLLVVGSTRRGPFSRVLVGDDTRATLDGAPCAIAIAPAGYAGQTTSIAKVGVGYDGSADSHRALITARALAAKLGARLAALEVVVFPSYSFSGPIAGDATLIADLVDQARGRVAALGDLEPHAAAGQPAEELAQWSSSLDLLVVGSRGSGPVWRLVHPSTSWELTRHVRCPLLVVPRARRAAARPDEVLDRLEPAAPSRR
ncbi:MAG TPA: universal stress protein [Solirubrobacteraceae bacterium]|nr:universal stress protein [Solirubrobacteraceae bacterium]